VAHEGDFNEWETCERYDLIVSNPPFFTDSLLPPDMSRSLARHGSALTYTQLIERASRLLTSEGSLAIISPTDAQEAIVEAATFASLPVRNTVNVIPVEGAPAKRFLWLLSHREMPFSNESLTIARSDGSFTHEYINLTKAFYLKM
jgi:tRNA1Val (adenine37-N6)-methyltransferase